jgi:hypothetical protein
MCLNIACSHHWLRLSYYVLITKSPRGFCVYPWCFDLIRGFPTATLVEA